MRRVLVVDDFVDLTDLVEARLRQDGYEVYVYNTGEGAFELAKQVKPELLILDIMLPGVTGYQICRRIRKDPELYRVPILILTALGEEPEILHGLEQGADDFLVKPFKPEQLTEKVAAMDALASAIETRNSLTDLPGTDAIKREIDHRLARDNPIAAVYIDMVGFKPYCAARGAEGQKRALQFMARLLMSLVRNLSLYESSIAHLGGEHFVVLVNLEAYENFSRTLAETFDRNVQQLYTPQEVAQGYVMAVDKRGREVPCPLMVLSIGVAHTQFRKFRSAKKVFEVLAQVRQMAQPERRSVIFADRRRTDR